MGKLLKDVTAEEVKADIDASIHQCVDVINKAMNKYSETFTKNIVRARIVNQLWYSTYCQTMDHCKEEIVRIDSMIDEKASRPKEGPL